MKRGENIKLKDKLRKWLFSEELGELRADIDYVKNEYEWLKSVTSGSINLFNKARSDCNSATKEIKECKEMMNQICNVGVDVARDEYHSWAVICVHGKMDFLKFVPLNNSDVREVSQLLKRFEYSKRVVDSPFAYRGMIKDLISEL